MSDFIRTVTITLEEYDQLRRDAAPVQNRVRDSVACLMDAYHEYNKTFDCGFHGPMKNAQDRLGKYLLYVQRCVLKAVTPVPFGDWEVWTKPGEPS